MTDYWRVHTYAHLEESNPIRIGCAIDNREQFSTIYGCALFTVTLLFEILGRDGHVLIT